MSDYKQRQSGFGVPAVLALVIIVSIIGFTAWFVTASSKKASSTLELTTKTNTNAPATGAKISDPSMPATPSAAVQAITYSKAPKELQTAILTETKAVAPACVKDGVIVDIGGKPADKPVKYNIGGFAQTGIGCDGGAATLFAKFTTGNAWTKVDATQFEYHCSALKQYKVPVAFLQAVSPDPTKDVECASADPAATSSEVYKL